MKGSTFKRCSCPAGRTCPDLKKRRHGSWGYDRRIETSDGIRVLRRMGFETETAASAALTQVDELIRLAGGESALVRKIGDLIFERTKRGGQLPAVEDVRRRLGLRRDPDASESFGDAWEAWLKGKRKARESYARSLEQIGRNWLLPVLADVELDRLGGEHCAMVFERIDGFNAELKAAAQAGRKPVLQGDLRADPRQVGVATQHRVYATLRTFLNFQWKRRHVIPFNPVYAVELEPEVTPEAQRWSAVEAARFLTATAGDPLGLMFRVAVLRGARRGELVGFRWSDSDLDEGYLAVEQTILQLGGKVVPDQRPKTRDSVRKVWLDDDTIALLKAHRKAQVAARLKASSAWEDNDLVFCREDGSPWPPDHVSRRFKALAAAAGVPVIKLHEGGRHSAASLQRDANVDDEIRRKTLGHADKRMTSHYTHIEAQAYRASANDVAAHVRKAGS